MFIIGIVRHKGSHTVASGMVGRLAVARSCATATFIPDTRSFEPLQRSKRGSTW